MRFSRRNLLQLAGGMAAAALPGRRAAAWAQGMGPAPAGADNFGESPYRPLPLTFFAHRLGTDHCEGVSVMDMNGDGRPDIVSGAYWYENPGAAGGPWPRHQFREVALIGEFVSDCNEFVFDVNKDGRPDLVTAGWQRDGLWWFENPGRVGPMWQAHKICHSIDTEGMAIGDLLGSGKADDLLACHYNSEGLLWVNFAGREPVVHHVGERIDGGRHGQGDGHGVGVGDVDGDGKNDILTRHGWFRNIDAAHDRWEWHPDWDLQEAGFPIVAYDVNGDGLMDIIYGHGHDYGLYWLEQVGGGAGRSWRRHLIDDSFSQVHAIALADLDGDGQPELIAGKRYRSDPNPGNYDPLVVYYYKLDRASRRFTRYPVSYNGTAEAGTQILAVDIDGDGDLDIVVAGKTGVHWLESYRVNNVPNAVREKELLYNYNWPFPGEGHKVGQQNEPADTPY